MPDDSNQVRSLASAPDTEPCESVRVVHLVAGMGVDGRRLADRAGVTPWALEDPEAMVPAAAVLRLWELAEQALADPRVGAAAAARCGPGDLGLFGYLFTSAGTLGAALEAVSRYLPLVTTGGKLQVATRSEQQITYSFRYPGAGGRGPQLAAQFWTALLCTWARTGTGQPDIPAHASLARIDFGATVTLPAAHLNLPMRSADPALAAILRRAAAALPAPAATTWHDHFARYLADAIEQGTPTLNELARRLSLSPRTLQRRLTEYGTTWRAELETARRHRATQVRQADAPTMTRLARHIGYTDPRSARRAIHRWNQAAP